MESSLPRVAATFDSTLEEFIAAFNRYEAEDWLFDRCVDVHGVRWWDYVRYEVQLALCSEQGLAGKRAAVHTKWWQRSLSLIRQSMRLSWDVAQIAFARREAVERLIVFGRPIPYVTSQALEQPRSTAVFGDPTFRGRTAIVARKQSMDFASRIVARFTPPSAKVAAEAARIEQELQVRFGSNVAIAPIIRATYARSNAARRVWSIVLRRLNAVSFVGFINDGRQRPLVELANLRGANTREYQHGYMGRSHIDYTYPVGVGPLTTLPHEVAVLRDTGDIVFPTRLVHVSHIQEATGAGEPARDIDVLIGSSPTRVAESMALIESLIGSGLRPAIKIHPSDTELPKRLRPHLASRAVQLLGSETPFHEAVRRARVYLPASPASTTSFEAVENGASLLIVHYGRPPASAMLDDVPAIHLSSVDEVPAAVRRELARLNGDEGDVQLASGDALLMQRTG